MNAHDFPAINAALNALAAILLCTGWIFIRRGNRLAHRNCMVAAFVTSCLFLVGYLYHKIFLMKGINTPFPGPRELMIPYLALLFTHVVLAMAIVPMALVTMNRGFRERWDAHRRIARWTLPVWLYVSVTGVLIYFLLYRIWT